MIQDIYLFLDIDGVFNGNYQHHNDIFDFDVLRLKDLGIKENQGDYVSKYKLTVFRNLTNKYNVKIVGVSSIFCGNYKKEEVEKFKSALDINLVDITRYTGGGLERGAEVLEYVKVNEIEKFIILDDSGNKFYDKEKFSKHAKNCVFPMGRFGLTDYHFECLEVIIKNLLNDTDEKPYTYTTKVCYNCGGENMITFPSMHYKECSACCTVVHWPLDKGQKPLLTKGVKNE